MSILRNRLIRRFSILGRIGDIALVAGMGLRLAQRKGWISDHQMDRAGLSGEAGGSIGPAEIAIAAAATYRLLRRKTRRRS